MNLKVSKDPADQKEFFGKTIMMYVYLVLFMVMLVIVYLASYRHDKITLKSHEFTYIPDDIELKDKDNKTSRHLKMRFVYVCPSDVFDQIKQSATHNNVKELFYFIKSNTQYTAFFVVETEQVSMYIHLIKHIIEYPYKLYDTYVMGDTRIFNNIEDILICQGYDRDAYGSNCLSTTYLNELCSNKLEYVKYFAKHGLMSNTTIQKYGSYPGFYVKAPYSSRSVCASKGNLDQSKCYTKEGVIVQAENHMLKKYEIKCYVINGSITMTIVRLDGINRNICVKDDMSNISPDLQNLLREYKSQIQYTCRTAFYCMNSLIKMRLDKLEHDSQEAEYVIDAMNININKREKLRIKYILTSLVNSAKYDLIDEINTKYNKTFDVSKFTKNVVDYNDPLKTMHNHNVKIYDTFMRIDLALPDDRDYNRITVTEIEPLASGIYLPKTVVPCMKSNELNDFNSIVKYNLYLILSNL